MIRRKVNVDLTKVKDQKEDHANIECLIVDFLVEMKENSISPLALAFNLSNTKISVWAIIEDNDEETEDKIILSEAKVNAKHRNEGFYLDTMILEKSDNYPIPSHYQKVV